MLTDEQIKSILLTEQYVSAEDLAAYTPDQGGIVDYLYQKQIINKELLGQAIAEYYRVPYIDIEAQKIDSEIFYAVPEMVARAAKAVALSRSSNGIRIACADPSDMETIRMLEKRFDEPVTACFSFPEDIEHLLHRYKADLKDAFQKTVQELENGPKHTEGDTIVTKIVDLLLEYGFENRASDIHVEPFRKKVVVRFRIDGVLHDVLEIESHLFEPVLSRIKILAKMRTDEHRAAQDGKLRFTSTSGVPVDVRVSVVPTNLGENIVMRLLSSESRQFELPSLGMGEAELQKIRSAIDDPHGMILVTGPTGSGKSTTLYALMKILNSREVHIATIEDPVEYDIEGVTQIQANPKTGLTFANGLRAIVRQDPDIIMVGEIRDEETAGIAVNSALTGHLVLSTLHTNDAATALPRLLDMKIEPFLVASTVTVIVAQRLVRKICQSCRTSYVLTPDELQRLQSDARLEKYFIQNSATMGHELRLYKGTGCNVCANTGFEGRLGIFEMLSMSEEIRKMVMRHENSDDIKQKARAEGMTTMMEDGISKVLAGQTTLEEVLRAARD